MFEALPSQHINKNKFFPLIQATPSSEKAEKCSFSGYPLVVFVIICLVE